MRHLRLPLAALLLTVGLAGSAAAAPITFSLNDPNPAVAGYPISFGGVVVNLTSTTTATILLTANESHPNAITFGGESAFALNVNAANFTIGTVTETNPLPGFTPTPDGLEFFPATVDGRGSFNFRLNNFDGFPHSARTIAFTLFNLSGIWTSSNDVLTSNNLGNAVAAHVFICSMVFPQCDGRDSFALTTGYVADGPTGKPTEFCTNPAGCGPEILAAPEPASLVLFGTGIAAVARFARRKKLTA